MIQDFQKEYPKYDNNSDKYNTLMAYYIKKKNSDEDINNLTQELSNINLEELNLIKKEQHVSLKLLLSKKKLKKNN